MKICLVFLIFSFFWKVQMVSNHNAFTKAFASIAEALTENINLVTVVMEGNPGEKDFASISSIADIPHVVNRKDHTDMLLDSSAIILVDSIASLEAFNKRTVLSTTFSMSQQLIVYVRNGTNDEEIATVGETWIEIPIVKYEYFMSEDEKSIRLLTFIWYAQEKCDVAQLVEVNKFDKASRRWQHGNFKIDKFSNFKGCRLNFLFSEPFQGGALPEFKTEEIDEKAKAITKCSGYTCAIVRDFSSALNYTYHMNVLATSGKKWPEIAHHMFVDSRSLNGRQSSELKNSLVFTRPVFFIENFLAVPPGEEFNGYEKMVLPFDEQTWTWIGIIFTSAFATIFVLRFLPYDIASFVMGREISTPALNVLAAFFGISQITCPGRNFARYLLMMFILFSLVIRTAYQGKMFEFLQKEMRKPTVTTVEEMIDQNFTFHMPTNYNNFNPESDIARRAQVIDNWTFPQLFAASEKTYTPGSRITTFYSKEVYHPVIRGQLNRTEPPMLLKNRYELESRALLFGAQHFLFDVFDRKLQQYIEADLVNYNIRKWNDDSDPKNFEGCRKPFAVLTLGELEAGFVVCIVPLVLSIFVFGIELILSALRLPKVYLMISKRFKWWNGT